MLVHDTSAWIGLRRSSPLPFSRFIALFVLPEHRDAQRNLLDTKLAAAHLPEMPTECGDRGFTRCSVAVGAAAPERSPRWIGSVDNERTVERAGNRSRDGCRAPEQKALRLVDLQLSQHGQFGIRLDAFSDDLAACLFGEANQCGR